MSTLDLIHRATHSTRGVAANARGAKAASRLCSARRGIASVFALLLLDCILLPSPTHPMARPSAILDSRRRSTTRTRRPIQVLGMVFAWGWFFGNISIPLAVLFGLVS